MRPMTAKEFAVWRHKMGLTYNRAAAMLGYSRRALIYFETGQRPIPGRVRLICDAVTAQIGQNRQAQEAHALAARSRVPLKRKR